MENLNKELSDELHRIYKKYYAKNFPSYVLRHRTLSTASQIVSAIQSVPFEDLTLRLYLFCKDDLHTQFVRKYESMIELASIDPMRFVRSLYDFYGEMERYIRKHDLIADFYDFLAFLYDLERRTASGPCKKDPVPYMYINIVMQQIDFLRPNKFNIAQSVVGIDTHGKQITEIDPFGTIDLPSIEFEKMMFERETEHDALDGGMFERVFQKYGFAIKTMTEYEKINATVRLKDQSVTALCPYINEYNTDILLKKPHVPYFDENEFPVIRKTYHYETELMRRRRALPPSGVVVIFKHVALLNTLLLKETVYDNAVVLLFKITTTNGEINGRYNTKTTDLFTAFNASFKVFNDGSEEPVDVSALKDLVLWAYTAVVCDVSGIKPTLSSMLDYFSIPDIPDMFGMSDASVVFEMHRPITYTSTEVSSSTRVLDPDKYAAEMKNINGYIRKLPSGQSASAEAIAAAEEMGYSLDPSETFVRPFVRQTWIIRQKGS